MRPNEMLSRWFINDTATASQQWRLKGHAVDSFWDWVASWARCAETPADLGYDASRFVLPPLNVHRHKAAGDTRKAAGLLFAADISATTMHEVKRHTAHARAEMVAALVDEVLHLKEIPLPLRISGEALLVDVVSVGCHGCENS